MTTDTDGNSLRYEVVEETEYTVRVRVGGVSSAGPSISVKTKKCVFCETPIDEMAGKTLSTHLADECESAPREVHP